MTDREVMQQALEALETLMLERGSIYETAITALREALAQPEQPEQEPVAWTTMPEAADWDFVSGSKDPTGKLEGKWFPLYTTSPAAQRPWQGLTDEEVQFYTEKHSKLVNAGYDKVTDTNLVAKTFDSTGFYKEVSTVLKERNT